MKAENLEPYIIFTMSPVEADASNIGLWDNNAYCWQPSQLSSVSIRK